MVKSIFFLIAISVAADLCAKVESVPSVYDEAKGKWIGDVSALVEKLGNSANGDVIYLGKGEYDLTGVLMENDETKFGKSHLRIQPGVKLLAEDEDRNETLLVGNGTARILRAVPPDYKTTYVPATIRGLTITNGFAKTFSGAAESKHGGGIYGDATLTNCVVAKCTAEGNGGALCGYIKVHKCLVSNNTASSSGGGTYKATEIKNSEIVGNSSANNGGGICAFTGQEKIFDSVVSGNYAAKNGGGISSYLVVSNCFVSLNTAENSGGGIDNPVYGQVKYVYDSDVCSNKAVTASCGGVSYYTVYRGSIFANYAQQYAGAYNCMLHQVTVHNNYSCTYGGGVVSSSAFGCTISNNFCSLAGPNSMSSTFVGCRISGTGVYGGVATQSIFENIGSGIRIAGNPYIQDASSGYGNLYEGIPVCTNCLFANNHLGGEFSSMFVGLRDPNKGMRVVNCTIVSNVVGQTFNYANNSAYAAEVKNCVFAGNKTWNSQSMADLNLSQSGAVTSEGIRFYNCAYGEATSLFEPILNCVSGEMFKFGENGFGRDPKFVHGEGIHPFALKLSSPLRSKGMPEEWMDDATDIRGEGFRRLRDGLVDIGCYQCWLMPKGQTIFVR